MKKALLLGIFDSTYIVHYINDVLIPLGYDVYILPDSKKINNAYIPNEKLHVVYSLKKESGNFLIRKFFSLKKFYSDVKKIIQLGPFDLIHVHYVSFKALLIAKKIKKAFGSKLAVTYWGSDILRTTSKQNKKNTKLLSYADYISSDSMITKNTFDRIYNNRFKLNVMYFGDSICTEIDRLDENRVGVYKKEFLIPENKTIVTVGYNARPAQQHLSVFKELLKAPAEKLNDFYFILPMTYCREDTDYIKALEGLLSESSVQYKIFDKYLSEEQIAKLRMVSDIFINSQTTDALCNTVKEFFYLGKIILNPTWLDYPELKEWNLKAVIYDDFSELKDKFLASKELVSAQDLEYNRSVFKNNLSWNDCKDNWEKVFEKLMHNS